MGNSIVRDRANKHSKKQMQNYLKSAKIRFMERYEKPCRPALGNLDRYELLSTLGAGSFGRVILLREKCKQSSFCAMKIMSKHQLVKSHHISHIIEEKRILYAIDFPVLIRLFSHYQDNSYVYLILEFINGGEMFTFLRKEQKFSECKARFYAAQVVLAFEYLHYMDIIYRDLKPENILIHTNGYIKIIDMGFAKHAKGIVWTLCGTPDYIAPEILMSKGYNKSVDWYALGILLYEMVAGFTPFWSDMPMKIYEKIIEGRLRFPSGFSTDLKDIIRKLLSKDLTFRYGNLKNGVNDIKEHRWFEEVHWWSMFKQEVAAPFIPAVDGPGDFTNFDILPHEPLSVAAKNAFDNAFAAW